MSARLGFPLYAGGALFVLAVAEGNFGTAYRHRAGLVWPMALLAAVGAHGLWGRRRSRPAGSEPRAPRWSPARRGNKPTVRVLRVIARMNVGGPALQVSALVTDLDDGFEQRLLIGDCDSEETDYLSLHQLELGEKRVPGLGRSVRPLDDMRAETSSRRDPSVPTSSGAHPAKAGVLGRVATPSRRFDREWPSSTRSMVSLNGYFGHPRRRLWLPPSACSPAAPTGWSRWGRVRDDLLAAGVGRPSQYVVIPRASPCLRFRPEKWPAGMVCRRGPGRRLPGRLTRIKRPDRLVDTLERVIRQVPAAHFLVAGGGDLFEDHAVGPACWVSPSLLGVRRDVEVVPRRLMSSATSDNEGTPVSLIEAGLAARPSVTTAAGRRGRGCSRQKTGFVVEPTAGRPARRQ